MKNDCGDNSDEDNCSSKSHFTHISSAIVVRLPLTKELSYCKQIAHQLRTQYVEGINSNSMTLKLG